MQEKEKTIICSYCHKPLIQNHGNRRMHPECRIKKKNRVKERPETILCKHCLKPFKPDHPNRKMHRECAEEKNMLIQTEYQTNRFDRLRNDRLKKQFGDKLPAKYLQEYLDRSTLKNYTEYMQSNPVYFATLSGLKATVTNIKAVFNSTKQNMIVLDFIEILTKNKPKKRKEVFA